MSEFRAKDHRLSNPGYAEPPRETDRLIPDHRPTTAGVVSFLSSNERQGRWELSRRFRALAVLGNVELDLREAEIGIGLSVIEAVAVMGNIEITVPPDITVECDGDSFMGTFTLKYERTSPSMASRDRVVRVTGTAYAGSVTIMVKGPDEGALKRLGRNLFGE
jgi:hypothetical protein